jgi:hypothetical protein
MVSVISRPSFERNDTPTLCTGGSDAKTAQMLKKFEWNGDRVTSLCFTHDNQMLVSAAGKTGQAWANSAANGK